MQLDAKTVLDNPGKRYGFLVTGIPVSDEFPYEFRFTRDVKAEGDYWSEDEKIFVSMHIEFSLEETCAKCLKPLEYSSVTESEVVFSQSDEDEEYYLTDGMTVMLDKAVLDEISLNQPMQYLCKEDCKGLCPICGQDLNEGTCDCDTSLSRINPFEKLKDLF